MANTNSTSSAHRVSSLREAIQPIEDLAAEAGVQFDTIVRPARVTGQSDRLEMSAMLTQGRIEFSDVTQSELATGYAEYLEVYAARLVKLAAELRQQFPATAVTTK